MPRKRTTRAKQPTKPKTEVEISQEFNEHERSEQLNVCWTTFDSQVKKAVSDLEKRQRTLLVSIQIKFEEHMAQIPKELRDMTLKEFAMAGGTFEKAMEYRRSVAPSTKTKTEMRLAELQNFKCSTFKRDFEGLEAIAEADGDNALATTVQTTTTARRNGKRTKTAMPPPSTRTSSRTKSQFATPATTQSRSMWGQTPLITPKFDPNLPVTPENVREMKPGERLMSLAGSPVQVNNRRKAMAVVNKDEIAHEWSDIAGIDLTPNRIERMLRLVSGSTNNN